MNRVSLIDLSGTERRRPNVLNPSIILILVPVFLIVSSSVYPAVLSSIENKEMLIISKVMAQLEGKDNAETSRYNAHMQLLSSRVAAPSSPTSVDPSPSATPSTFKESIMMQQQQQQQQQKYDIDTKMDATTISKGDTVHVVWEDNTPGNFDIFYKRAGADFDPSTINLSNNAGSSFFPKILVSGNTIHLTWTDNTAGNFEILYRRSTDGGATFGPEINLSNNVGQSARPAIALSGNNVHVVWDDNTPGNSDILYRRSTDGGASFTEPTKNLSANSGSSANPAIAVSGNNVHVVWDDNTPGNSDIFYRRSTNSGSTFPNVIKNVSSNTEVSELPAIAASGNIVHVVWADNTGLNYNILYRRSTDDGTTFPNLIKNLSNNVGTSQGPVIAVSGNNVHVAWTDNTPGNPDILYRRSTDGGASFTDSIKNLSSNTGSSFLPTIALSSNNVYVVWADDTLGNPEILYRTSSDNGATFSSLLTNLSVNVGGSTTPIIAAS